MAVDERNRVIIGEETIKVVTVGIQGPPGAGLSFNDIQGEPDTVGIGGENSGTSLFAARRDHKHELDVEELDAHVATLAPSAPTTVALAAKADKTYVDAQDQAETSRAEAAEQANATAVAGKYSKPAGGIPEADLAGALSSKIDAASTTAATAYQKPGTGIPKADLATGVQSSLGAADTAVQTVNGHAGTAVTVGKADVGLGNVPNVDATQRANHTGTQTASTISDFATATDARITAQKGNANGLATLDSGGKVPAGQLPSFVDDVLEYANLAAFPATGETSKIYVADDTGLIYRWGGSSYVNISASPGSTDAVPEGANNKYYTDARAAAAAPVQSVAGKVGAVNLVEGDISGLGADLAAKANLSGGNTFTGTQNFGSAPLPSGNKAQDLGGASNYWATTHTARVDFSAVSADGVNNHLWLDSSTGHLTIRLGGSNYQLDQQYGAATDALNAHLALAETFTAPHTFNVGSFLDKGNLVFDVRAYGAKADGTTNDSAAFVAAWNAAGAAGGGIVWAGPGTYYIASSTELAYGNVSLQGAGMGKTVFLSGLNSSSSHLFYLESISSNSVSNVDFVGFTINLNGKMTGGIEVRGNQSTAVVSGNINYRHVEVTNMAASPSGFVGGLSFISDGFNSRVGTLGRVSLEHVYIHDFGATTSTNTLGHAINVHSNSMTEVRATNTIFKNLYSSTIAMSSTVTGEAQDETAATRPLKNWIFDHCSFIATCRNYWGFLQADIHDSSRNGMQGVKVLDCYWDWTNNGWNASPTITNLWDIRAICLVNCRNLDIRGNTFRAVRTVLGLGYSFPLGYEDINVHFSDNTFDNCWETADPDGVWGAIYTDNIFYRTQRPGDVIAGYGRHFPSRYAGNMFINCGYDPNSTYEPNGNPVGFQNGTAQSCAIALLQGDVFENNVIYNDTASYPLDYFMAESNASVTGSSSYPVVIKNNTFLGYQPLVATFGLRSSRQHFIQGNIGIKESVFKYFFNTANDVVLSSPLALASSDVAVDNWQSSGAEVSRNNPINMGGNRAMNVGTPVSPSDSATKAYVDATSGANAIPLIIALG